jgi:protein TonB
MQRSLLSPRDRTGAVVAVVLVHLGLAVLVLNASGGIDVTRVEDAAIETFDVSEPPPPPPPVVEVPAKAQPKKEGEASPPNLVSKATPVAAPKPRIELPPQSPMVATTTPNQGTQATQGAAPVPGPGTGAGGIGNGTGSGGSGNGPGGGGVSGEAVGPSVIPSTRLTGRDYPPEVLRAWPRGGRTFVAIRVQLDGRATDCKINRSSGDPIVDAWTCRLVEQRVRFRPARDARGQPYVAWYGYVQRPVNF